MNHNISKHNLSCIFLYLLLLRCTPLLAGWQRPVTNYTRHSYHAGTQNWDIAQHANGWIYVANNKGLLEFDGKYWNTYPIRNAKARAVKIGHDGKIYVGGQEQFGYFTPDSLGGLHYTCLSERISYKGIIWNILADRERIYFQSDINCYCFDGEQIKTITFPGVIQSSLLWKNRFYTVTNAGLLLLNGKEFKTLASTSEIGTVVKEGGLLPYGEEFLLVSRNNGLFRYDGKEIRRFPTAADEFCRKSQLFCADLRDSLLVLGSVQNGICLLNLQNNETEIISTNNGLQNKTILSTTFDADGQLWLGLDNGIDCIHLNARLTSLSGGKGEVGSGYASCHYQGKYYLGTNQGLYRTSASNYLNSAEPTEIIPGTSGQIWSILEHDERLFCCSDNGIFIIKDHRIVQHITHPWGVWNVKPVPGHTDLLLGGTYGSLFLLRKQGDRWSYEATLKNFWHSCKNMLMEDGTNLWIANKENGVCRLTLSDDLKEVVHTRYYNREEFPVGYDACLTLIDNRVVVASHYGLWRYDHVRDSLERYAELEQLLEGRTAYTYLNTDSLRNIWYVTNGTLKLLRYENASQTYGRQPAETFLHGMLIENFEHVQLYGRQRAIASTEEGFTLINLARRHKRQVPMTLQIRRVYLTGQHDSLVYGRSYTYEEGKRMVIPYSHNSLRIEYCAVNHSHAHPTRYAYRLKRGGKESAWSEYSEASSKEFTALFEGEYEFSVKVMINGEEQPETAAFTFKVLPPWYRSWWSYLSYALIGVLMIYYVYHRIETHHKHQLMRRELEFYHKEQKFEQEREQQDRKIDSLQAEKLQEELRHKSEELVQSTLNIVRKNEILQEIRKEVMGISHAARDENLVSIRRKTVRLLGKIDTNIENDDGLQAFQNSFDTVHHRFFLNLEQACPNLSSTEKQLCAYLLTDMQSKEIAPLMNISVRSVEIARFRLRKKLGLDKGESLAKFLQQFAGKN